MSCLISGRFDLDSCLLDVFLVSADLNNCRVLHCLDNFVNSTAEFLDLCKFKKLLYSNKFLRVLVGQSFKETISKVILIAEIEVYLPLDSSCHIPTLIILKFFDNRIPPLKWHVLQDLSQFQPPNNILLPQVEVHHIIEWDAVQTLARIDSRHRLFHHQLFFSGIWELEVLPQFYLQRNIFLANVYLM